MGLSILSIVSAGGPGTNPLQLLWDNCNYFLSQVKEIMINGEDLKKEHVEEKFDSLTLSLLYLMKLN